jgi:hypothetical protein
MRQVQHIEELLAIEEEEKASGVDKGCTGLSSTNISGAEL